MMNQRLSKKQGAVYNEIRRQITDSGISPTLEELRQALDLRSLNSVKQFVDALEKRGLIRRRPYEKRNIELVSDAPQENTGVVLLPVIASAGCDALNVFSDQRFDEHLTVDSRYIPKNKSSDNLVVFKAIGQSMEGSGINSGDYVLVERTNDVSSGDRVVASIGDMAVIKRLQFGQDATILEPDSHNPYYKKIVMKDNSSIFGKVLDVIKTSIDEHYILEFEDGRTEFLN